MINIIFAGTPEFAVPTLQALLENNYNVVAVYTQPDRPAGRGQKLTPSPVKQFAMANCLPIVQPLTLRDNETQKQLAALNADVMIVVAYGLILPQAVLQIPRYGCLNVHASLLPRWRGAAPIQRAILAGDNETGVTIMQMDKGLDTGAMLLRVNCPINQDTTSNELHTSLASMGAAALINTLELLQQQQLKPQQQDETLATYAAKISKEEARIEWQATAIEIDRMVRAFNPWPVAFTSYKNEIIRIWRSEVNSTTTTAKAGTILVIHKNAIEIATSEGTLLIKELQLPGHKRMTVADFLNAKQDFFQVGALVRLFLLQ